MRFLVFSLLILASCGPLSGAQKDKNTTCTKEDAIQAETEASSLKGWVEVYRSYGRYAQCDDGAIGEGYSDSVARLLAEDWSNVNQLNTFALRDKGFEEFVLRHVDELISPAQQKKIFDNATAHCPAGLGKLCKRIVAQIKKTQSN